MKRLLLLVAALGLVAAASAPAVLAADPTPPQNNRVLVSVGGDVTLPAGDHADAVLVVNGTGTILGDATSVVVINGALNVQGATVESIVAVRSPVTLGPGSVVSKDVATFDSAVTKTGDAVVQGEVRDVGVGLAGIGFVLAPLMILAWLGFALAAIASGLLLAALGARQVRAAEAIIRHEPLPTILVGIGGVILPIVVGIPLFLTIVGAPLALGMWFMLWPLVALIGYLVAGIAIGDWVLGQATPTVTRERPYLASIIGLVALQVLGIVPFLSAIASLVGFGAVLMLAWRVFRHRGAGETPVVTPIASPTPA
jgi:hypothetical protein